MAVQPIPEGYHSITPYLIVDGGARALEFYAKAFGAREKLRIPGPGGSIAHAEMLLGDSMFMLADESPASDARSPKSVGGTPVTLMVYVEDVDRVFARAVEAGAKVQRPLANQFYGDRTGGGVDPFGHKWYLAQHVEDVSPEEMDRRMKAQRPG